MSDPSQMRVADADREQMVEELREHALAGRLSSEEMEERIGSAYRARTRADLDALRAEADEVICLHEDEIFSGIGAFYRDFHQLGDAEVISLLDAAMRRAREGSGQATQNTG